MNNEVTVEKTGRLMKKSENKPYTPWSIYEFISPII
jgi:hypothetical protein